MNIYEKKRIIKIVDYSFAQCDSPFIFIFSVVPNYFISFRDAMRNGDTDDKLLSLIGQAVQRKHPKHAGIVFYFNNHNIS